VHKDPLARAALRARRGQLGHLVPPGPKGDPGAALALRVVTGTDTVQCRDDETLVSLLCANGAPDGSKCASAGAAATGLCMRK
jgi:hypothetical protein